jgi:hypothetical protein
VALCAVLDPQTVSHPGDVSMSHNSVPLGWAAQPDRPICVRADVKTARIPPRQNEMARGTVRASRRTPKLQFAVATCIYVLRSGSAGVDRATIASAEQP